MLNYSVQPSLSLTLGPWPKEGPPIWVLQKQIQKMQLQIHKMQIQIQKMQIQIQIKYKFTNKTYNQSVLPPENIECFMLYYHGSIHLQDVGNNSGQKSAAIENSLKTQGSNVSIWKCSSVKSLKTHGSNIKVKQKSDKQANKQNKTRTCCSAEVLQLESTAFHNFSTTCVCQLYWNFFIMIMINILIMIMIMIIIINSWGTL